MAATSPSWLLKIITLSVIATLCFGNYVITTPRKWISGEVAQVCVFTLNNTATENTITVAVKSSNNDQEYLVPNRVIQIPPGKSELCDKVLVPALTSNEGQLEVTGSLGGKKIHHKKTISLVKTVTKTFIQTDKFMYKPDQDVNFRILTVVGPLLKISTDKYPLVWIETPSGSRIAQWTEVDNSGLVQQSMKLSDEPEQGTYKIHVHPPKGENAVIKTFKVEEYVLPRFEVTVKPPNYLLGSDPKFNLTVCAKYTYGQPVRGNFILKVDNGGWGSGKTTYVTEGQVFGCKDLEILAESVQLNGEHFHAYNLDVAATVVEDGTGEEFKADVRVTVHRNAITYTYVGKEDFVKPNLPFTGRVKATFPDGSPAGGSRMQVCAGGQCKSLLTSPRGIVEFIYQNATGNHVTIKATEYISIRSPSSSWRHIMYDSIYNHELKSYFSPSGSSVIIYAPQKRLKCLGEQREHLIPILYAAANQITANFTVQVVSRGQIQFSSTYEHELLSKDLPIDEENLLEPLAPPPINIIRGFIEIPVRLPPTVSPKAMLVVWYSRDDGEVVSDTQELKIEKCFSNKVNLAWSRSKAQPGEQVDLNLSAEPESLCSLGVVDKSVELLSSQDDDLTVDKVFELVEEFMVKEQDNPQSDDKAFCKKQFEKNDAGSSSLPDPIRPRLVPFLSEGDSDNLPTDDSSRVKRSLWFEKYFTNYVDALKIFDKSGLFFFSDLITETRPCNTMEESGRSGFPSFMFGDPIPGVAYSYASIERDLDSVHDVDEMVEITSEAKPITPRVYFPETWLWQLSSLPASGVSSEQLNLPDTITEWVGKAVCVHPEKGLGVSKPASITTFTLFFIDLTLPPTVKRGEILPVKISIFNYHEAALPVKVKLEESSEYVILEEPESQKDASHHSSCIPPQEKAVHTIKIRSLVLGEVNLTVTAFVDELYPEVCGSEYIISQRDVIIKPIKVEAEGFPREKTWTKYICSKDIEENADFLEKWNIEPPPEIIKDSSRGWITAVGDLLGPTLENLGSLVRMPYGCGEQNMLNFAPNIFILQYLEASNQTTPEIGDKAVEYMKQGYQRELNYRHKDGSYSAFGSSDSSGSTWLTAFVLKSFSQARQFIMIDEDDLDMSRTWLKRRQMENGCFDIVGKVLHKGMKGGIDSSGTPAPFTAYVLISLLEAGEPSSSGAVSEAAFCLLQDKTQDPYTLVLKAYALALARLSEAEAIIEQLISQAVENSHSMYWEIPAGAGRSDAVAVETAGYAILAMMTLDSKRFDNQARKVVKWISSKRNGQGGFISTQDTVVALQALASFEGHQDHGTVNLVVTIAAESLEHNFHIVNSNKLLQQMVNLPKIPSNVVLDMEGEGCVLVQGVLRYNVPDAKPSEAFLLSVNTETAPDQKCVTKRIQACASYQLPDKKSNMAVIEVNLVSGYIPEKADLKQIVGYGTGLLKRYEVDGNRVTFYIDEFSSEDICVSFRIIREIDVEDVKPGTVKIYDYYQPELSVSKSFILPPNDECQRDSGFPIDGIIEGPIFIEEDEEVDEANVLPTVNPEDIADLVAELDEII